MGSSKSGGQRCYRDILRGAGSEHVQQQCVFILLNGSAEAGRRRHFMSPHLLQSQLETLEPPLSDELSVSCDVDHQTVDEIVEYVYKQIKTH